MTSLFFLVFLFSSLLTRNVDADPNYIDALSKSLLFFQGQRSGPLPTDQKISWRGNSGVNDGSLANVDLTGGYYTEGDNVKHNFPMAFTTTMLSWSTLEYGGQMGPELQNARVSIRWATDYLLKCATKTQGQLYVGVGDLSANHPCWERPEDMDTPRTVYSVSASNPGSDVAAETAAALAAASMVFREVDPQYSTSLLATSKIVMEFAMQHQGSHSDAPPPRFRTFYYSYSVYKDELMWGAAWLLKATDDLNYKNFIESLGGGEQTDIFNWNNKYSGAYVLLSQRALVNNDSNFEQYKQEAESFICKILPNTPSSSTSYTSGGLMYNYKLPDSNLQHVTAITFLLTTYANYMKATQHRFYCGNSDVIVPDVLIKVSKQQVDYILGENPAKMSYMVGYGPSFPMRIHHRGSSIPSQAHPNCTEGNQFLYTPNPNPNILTGAIVGGPDEKDEYLDKRDDYIHSEPATYINAPFVGTLAYFASGGSA
ncbi:Endoglucanase 9 [Raphanus sativus]|uniref:Endoglucanase n=1 Tax=Raphanus sativus TaxID=3726 RepID=A0A6J0MJJ3_RAPSA|nr:endoglucanase 9 [Raphanus sativus]KAJ4909496.1 Endoglucanase 9 [Raphanus sativus]